MQSLLCTGPLAPISRPMGSGLCRTSKSWMPNIRPFPRRKTGSIPATRKRRSNCVNSAPHNRTWKPSSARKSAATPYRSRRSNEQHSDGSMCEQPQPHPRPSSGFVLSPVPHPACRQGRLVQDRPYPDLPHLPGQTGRQQVLADSEKDQDQKVQPHPVHDQALERGASGMAGKDEAGRAERPGKVQQLRSAVPLTRRLTHCPGRSDKVVSYVAGRTPGV